MKYQKTNVYIFEPTQTLQLSSLDTVYTKIQNYNIDQ